MNREPTHDDWVKRFAGTVLPQYDRAIPSRMILLDGREVRTGLRAAACWECGFATLLSDETEEMPMCGHQMVQPYSTLERRE